MSIDRTIDFYVFDNKYTNEDWLYNKLVELVNSNWSGFEASIKFLDFNNTNYLLAKRDDFTIRCHLYVQKQSFQDFQLDFGKETGLNPKGKIRLFMKSNVESEQFKEEHFDISFHLYDYLSNLENIFVYDVSNDDVIFCNVKGNFINYP